MFSLPGLVPGLEPWLNGAVEPARAPLAALSGATVLGIGAHPDDLELGVGGTLARMSRAGARVVMAIVSIPNHLELRKEEARRAAECLGAEVRFLSPDRCSRVEDYRMYELVGMIDAVVADVAPTALFSHCLANHHFDHKLVHEACVATQRLKYFDFFCYSPTSCRAVNIDFHPHVFIDIGETIEAKMEAIKAHHTQFGGRGLSIDHYRSADNRLGESVGVKYAEGVEVVRMPLK